MVVRGVYAGRWMQSRQAPTKYKVYEFMWLSGADVAPTKE